MRGIGGGQNVLIFTTVPSAGNDWLNLASAAPWNSTRMLNVRASTGAGAGAAWTTVARRARAAEAAKNFILDMGLGSLIDVGDWIGIAMMFWYDQSMWMMRERVDRKDIFISFD